MTELKVSDPVRPPGDSYRRMLGVSAGLWLAHRIPATAARLARSPEEAAEYAREIGYPVVLKVVSPEILHKWDAGCVTLNLENEAQVRKAYEDIIGSAHAAAPAASVLGVSVQKMAPQGTEVIIGMKRDPHSGPVLLFGLGGVLVALLKDTAVRLIPVGHEEALEMMAETKLHLLLEGYRQFEPADKQALASILLKVSALAQ